MATVRSAWVVESLQTLTAVGATNPLEISGTNSTFQVTVSGIGTDVVIRLEGSVDGVGYFNLNDAGTNYTITANGTYGYGLGAACPVRFVRLVLVSFSGGTPSVACVVGQM
jgi:hypothetical protein